MSIINSGNQEIFCHFKFPLKGSDISQSIRNVMKPGIYRNNDYLTLLDFIPATAQVLLNPFDAVVNAQDANNNKSITVHTSTQINLSTDTSPALGNILSSAPYITANFIWYDQVFNYLNFFFRAIEDITTDEIVFGKALFSGSSISGFDYSEATIYDYQIKNNGLTINNNLYVNGLITADLNGHAYRIRTSAPAVPQDGDIWIE